MITLRSISMGKSLGQSVFMDCHFSSVIMGSAEFSVAHYVWATGFFRVEGSNKDMYHMHIVVRWLFFVYCFLFCFVISIIYF